MTFRRRYLFLALAGVTLIGIGSVPWPAERLPLQARLAEELQAATGHVLSGGHAQVTFLPAPRLQLDNVTITPADAPQQTVLTAERIAVHLKLWPLMLGQVRAEQIIVQAPRIAWNGPQRPRDLWLLVRRTLPVVAASAAAEDAADRLPRRITIIDGTVVTHGGNRTLLRRVNASIHWPSIRRPVAFDATALWRGEPVDLRIDKLHPASLAAGNPSPLTLRFSAQPASFSFTGQIGADDMPGLEGQATFRTGSLARATAWLRTPLTFAREAGQISLKGTTRLTADGLSIPDARIEVVAGTLEGALAVRRTDAGRVLVSATLDAPTFDFNRLFANPPVATRTQQWQRSLTADTTNGYANDADIRLSITRAHIGTLEMQDVAAGIMVSSDRLEFALSQAQLEGGAIRGRLQFAGSGGSGGSGASARLNGVFEGIDAQKTLQRLFGHSPFAGKASGTVALAGTGRPARPLDGLTGSVSASIDQGGLIGVDLANVLDRARHSPLATALDWRGGHTPFTSLTATLAINDGIGHLEGKMQAEKLAASIAGAVDITDRTLDLRALAHRGATADGDGAMVSFPIEISGSWDYPVVTPDIRQLIERSDAVPPQPSEPREAPATPVQ